MLGIHLGGRLGVTVRERGCARQSTTVQALKSGDRVVVAGGTGGIGQLCAKRLVDKGFEVRIITRDIEKAESIFSGMQSVEIVKLDLKELKDSSQDVFEGCTGAVIAVGTTAFPTERWRGDNGPRQTDYVSVKNFIDAMPSSLQHVAMCTSAGVDRPGVFPFCLINSFGVLTYKKAGEECLKHSGVPYTIVRPGQLTEGPFTGKGVNDRLLRASTGKLKGVRLSEEDNMSGRAARSMVAELLSQSFVVDEFKGRVLAMESFEGEGPETDSDKWRSLIPTF